MPTNVTFPPSVRATLARAGVSDLHTSQVDAQKLSTIGLPASRAMLTAPEPLRLGSNSVGATRSSLVKPRPCAWGMDVALRDEAVAQCSPSTVAVESTMARSEERRVGK